MKVNSMSIKQNKFLRVINSILKWLSTLILVILVIIGLTLIAIFVSGKIAQSKGKTPPISLYTIISPSMTPNINVYDVVVVKTTDTSALQVGDVISFYSNNVYFDGTPITHRIVEKYNTEEGISYRTKGDANAVVDNDYVYEQNIVGKVIFKIPALGRVQFFLASQGGWFIAIFIPALAVISYDIVKILKLITIKNKINRIKKQSKEIDDDWFKSLHKLWSKYV